MAWSMWTPKDFSHVCWMNGWLQSLDINRRHKQPGFPFKLIKLVKSNTDAWWLGLAHRQDSVQISTPHWKNHSFMAVSRCVGGDVMLKQEQGQTVETQSTHYMPYSCNSKSRCYFNLWDTGHVCPVSQLKMEIIIFHQRRKVAGTRDETGWNKH